MFFLIYFVYLHLIVTYKDCVVTFLQFSPRVAVSVQLPGFPFQSFFYFEVWQLLPFFVLTWTGGILLLDLVFSSTQKQSLRKFQADGALHSFTCGHAGFSQLEPDGHVSEHPANSEVSTSTTSVFLVISQQDKSGKSNQVIYFLLAVDFLQTIKLKYTSGCCCRLCETSRGAAIIRTLNSVSLMKVRLTELVCWHLPNVSRVQTSGVWMWAAGKREEMTLGATRTFEKAACQMMVQSSGGGGASSLLLLVFCSTAEPSFLLLNHH